MAVIPVITLVFLTLALVIPFSAAACTFVEIAGKKGSQSEWKGFQTGKTKAECKGYCTSDASCVAAEYVPASGDCVWYHETQTLTDDSARTFLKLECDSCSMSRTDDTKGGVTTVQFSLTSADQCSSACLYITECQGVKYSNSTKTCSIYGGTPSASNTGDDLNFVKCSAGNPCCMSATITLKADAASLFQLTSSLESCEALCLGLSNCTSVYFLSNVCYVYTQSTTTAQQTGSIYSVKTCTGASSATNTVILDCIGASGSKPFHSLYLGFLVTVFVLLV